MGLLTGLILYLTVTVTLINCKTPVQCVGKPKGTYLAGSKGCQSYIYCDGENSYQGNCPQGLAFNPLGGICDDRSKVQCHDEIISQPRPSPASPSDAKFVCPQPASYEEVLYLPDTESCSHYYMCYHATAVLLSCPNDLHFSPQKQQCDSQKSANCTITAATTTDLPTLDTSTWRTTVVPSSPPTKTTGTPSTEIWSTPTGIIENFSTTLTTIVSTAGTSTPSQLPSTINPSTKSPILSTTPELPTILGSDTKELCSQKLTGYFAHPNDCHYYYRCTNGVLYMQECSVGFGWDANKKMCTISGC